MPATVIRLDSGTLSLGGRPLLEGVHAELALEESLPAQGCFLRARFSRPLARWSAALGTVPGARRYTCTYRREPFWMVPQAGTDPTQVPGETQWLLVDAGDDRVVLIVPLIESPFRASLVGRDGALRVVVETGDPAVIGSEALAVYVAVGPDPYALCAQGAQAVRARLPRCRLRQEKPVPAFADDFGWCTWDAFYQEVSHEKVREGLESLRAAKVPPRLLILDDGWQSERTIASGERRLTGFPANAKFPGDLAPTVAMAKQEFGVRTFLVWHALHGYWGGVDPEAFPELDIRVVPRSYGPGILATMPNANIEWWGALVGVVAPSSIHRFFHAYHRHLRTQGVDGVKVDNQAATEGVGMGFGGRVRLMEAYREALESSVQLLFGGRLINCMSCANEMFYTAEASTLTRTSTDFWPNLPASHGQHLATNAQVGMWFGEFCWPDWDMFQSGHAMGAFHAAGRAVSGSPVYVSDKPGTHDGALLRKLVLSDGTTARALEPGRPTRDCLFADPTTEDRLLKIWNRTPVGGLIGAFHARHHAQPEERRPITGEVSPADVPGLAGSRFAVFAHHAGTLQVLEREERLPVTLPPQGAEVFSIVAIEDGAAPIGLIDRFASGATILRHQRHGRELVIELRDGGTFACYTARAPRAVLVDDEPVAKPYLDGFGVRVRIRRAGAHTVRIRL